MFNNLVRMTDAGIELVADPRHAEFVIRDLGLEKCRSSRVPGAKVTKEKAEHRVIKRSGNWVETEGRYRRLVPTAPRGSLLQISGRLAATTAHGEEGALAAEGPYSHRVPRRVRRPDHRNS